MMITGHDHQLNAMSCGNMTKPPSCKRGLFLFSYPRMNFYTKFGVFTIEVKAMICYDV